MKTIPMFHVDAFTNKIFSGNGAAVCILDEWLEQSTMRHIAAENNLSETAFIVKDGAAYHIRWFTPKIEIELCGHATLATAHVLFKHLGYKEDSIVFKSKSGKLTVKRESERLTMNFPARYPLLMDDIPADLLDGLDVKPVAVYKDMNFLVLLENEQQLKKLRPRFRILSRIDYAGMICTAPSADPNYDFVSRYFAPYAGINEDPVTGSVHTSLTKYWSAKLNKKELVARQISRRGGVIYCRDLGDRVEVGGQAVTFFEGKISI